MAKREDWEKLFLQTDKNKDGVVTITELVSALQVFGYPGTDHKLRNLLHAEEETDKKLSIEEFVDSMDKAPVELHAAAMLNTIFTHYDANLDGEITMEELRSASRKLGKELRDDQLEAIMMAADTDGSGTINMKEFMAAVSKKVL